MTHYWLFKAEPDVYGLSHLQAEKRQRGRWDGIRNYQARNFLRDQVAEGDGVLFYHSSCKEPGIVAQVEVVRSAYPDPTQFDPNSPYYDPKSDPQNPRWVSVDIQLIRAFACALPLKQLKQDPALTEMVLLRQPRLSIQPVSPAEWRHINGLA